MALYVVLYCYASCTNCVSLADKTNSSDDNSWYGTPHPTLPQSKQKQNATPPHEEARPRQNKEDRKRRRLEAKRQKSKTVAVEENMEVCRPKTPVSAVSCQSDAPQVRGDLSSINMSMVYPDEDDPSQLSGGLSELQAGLRSEGVRYHLLNGKLSNLE